MVSWKMQIDLIWWSQAVHQSNFGRKKLFSKNIIPARDSSQSYCISISRTVDIDSSIDIFCKTFSR